ncbi:hypothetical protein QR680_012979 [Steinernema hermaphroditum]|uniref:Uncharacterized protein n=1 Tax=Steinernema hermaphroditum TaxID=289476 RepID=A0AA39I6B3_9BILA|nr:hypothetical protein QR680_012979 [Steinernema hermaphroditum]
MESLFRDLFNTSYGLGKETRIDHEWLEGSFINSSPWSSLSFSLNSSMTTVADDQATEAAAPAIAVHQPIAQTSYCGTMRGTIAPLSRVVLERNTHKARTAQLDRPDPEPVVVNEIVGEGPARREKHLKRMAEQRHHVKQAADSALESFVMTVLGNSVGSRTVRQMAVVRPKVPYRTREEQADIDLKKELRQPLDFLRPEQRKTIEHLSDCAKRIDLLEAFDRHVAENRARPILERVKNIADDVAHLRRLVAPYLRRAPRSSYRRELSAAINWRLECKQKEKKADMARYVKRIEQGYKLALKQRGIPYACRFLVKSPEHDEALHRVRRMFYGTSSSEREARCLGNKKLRKDLAKRRGELMHEKDFVVLLLRVHDRSGRLATDARRVPARSLAYGTGHGCRQLVRSPEQLQ